jgi:PAS domain S-box-containing protein
MKTRKTKVDHKRKKLANAARKAAPASRASISLPIIGVGASTAGLEALEHFLARVPKSSGMAFVIVQHLDPTRKGTMPELLQRNTGMKVIQVRDRALVQPDCVYVIPPNKDMSLLHGVLHLLEPASRRGVRPPIDVAASLDRENGHTVIRDLTARKHAEMALQRLAAIVESSNDAIIGKDPNGIITSWNKGAERIFGYTAREMVGASIMRLIPTARRNEEEFILGKIRRGEKLEHFETVRQTKDGRLIDVSVTVSPIKDATGKVVGVSKVARDITVLKKAERVLRESERRFREMIDALPAAIYTTDAEGRLTHFNPAAIEFSGRVPELGSDHWCVTWKLFNADGSPLPHDQCPMAIALKGGRIPRGVETMLERPDGTRVWFAPYPTPLRDSEGRIVGGINMLVDITERKNAERAQRRMDALRALNRKLKREILRRQAVEKSLKQSEQQQSQLLEQSRHMQDQLRNLSRRVLHSQEEERKRISRELHDVIAQTLTSINVRLAILREEALSNTKGLDESIARTQQLVEDSVNIVHRFARELRPPVLDDLGLIPALRTFMKTLTKETRIRVSLSAFAEVEKVNSDKRTVLYRVAQEALTNIARHAQARRAEVKIEKLDGAVCMTIKDDGKGFQTERVLHVKKNRRLGLVGMKERLEMAGGNFTVTSGPGKGTNVVAQIPLIE